MTKPLETGNDHRQPGGSLSERVRSRRGARRGRDMSHKDWKRSVPLATAGIALLAIVSVRMILVWRQEDPRKEWSRYLPPEVPRDDQGIVQANTLYARCLELMSRRRFDEAVEVVEQARAAHIRLIERFPLEKYPQMKWVEGQERQLANYERLLSERDTADELRALALQSQKRMREANLKKALDGAEILRIEGKYDEAIELLRIFAKRHEGFEVAEEALKRAAEIEQGSAAQHP